MVQESQFAADAGRPCNLNIQAGRVPECILQKHDSAKEERSPRTRTQREREREAKRASSSSLWVMSRKTWTGQYVGIRGFRGGGGRGGGGSRRGGVESRGSREGGRGRAVEGGGSREGEVGWGGVGCGLSMPGEGLKQVRSDPSAV